MSYIQDVPKVMQISAFMSNSKCPELVRRFFDQVLKTVTEMMKKVDDFVKSEEAYKSTELPRGEFPEKGKEHCTGEISHPVRHMEVVNKGRIIIITSTTRTIINRMSPPSKQPENGHCTNDCNQLKRQLEAALEFEKLNHLIKDIRQRGSTKGRQPGNNNGKGKVINMCEGYLSKHYFDNLPPSVKARLAPTQTELVGFYGEQLIPMGKVELEVAFGSEGL
ncbi:hypothetical protein Tco_0071883 [Tanacetum coccineum]